MTSVDEIFKKSGVVSKRKLDSVRDPNEIYKSAKTSSNGASRHTSAADEDEEMEAGPTLPPDDGEDEQDFGPEMLPDNDDDDEEGRFFGGGVTKQEYKILDYVEGADTGRAEDKIDVGWLRKTALNFEKRISKNAEMRAKFESEPQKFIGSEGDLDADIKALSVLSEHPELFVEFVRLGCANSLVGLLAHENTDIAIDAIEVIGELIDEDVAAKDHQWNTLVDALIDADLPGLIVSNLSRLDESDESDRNGVYYALGIVESLCSRTPVAIRVGDSEELLRWLLSRIQRTEATVTQNKQYSAEILAILSQASQETRRGLIQLDAIDLMLQLISSYRKRDPEKGGEEEEYMENIFEALTCLVDEVEGKVKFVEAEGVELCLLMLKEGKMSKGPALRLLDHAAAGNLAGQVCQKIVQAGGLKSTFTLFIKTHDRRLLSRLVAIFASMLRLLPATSAERIRTLAKFVEKDYEKVTKLMTLRRDYSARVKQVEQANEAEQQGASEEEADELQVELLSRRLEAGLFTLQTIDVIFAWLVAEDKGARRKIKQLLAERDETLAVFHTTLSEQRDGLDTSEEDGQDMKEMLGTLLEFLQ
ncbi:beta-catenin-like protein 1 [Geosmithia morbida]|uniref:Beta-catenin-like protein 1 n=1 Tax=Geosmithia morbida TaxID=1094350 RepID=A0A9P4Z201_9HYPO|nr:beta-catenin-like protein 1 [Geosmithia morbida]KAF4125962.1 beta-catenin-like protein 1 [Geosmithia morbida]